MSKRGEAIASIKGSAKTLLSGERIALNFLQRLSGIATLTAQFVERIKPLKTAYYGYEKDRSWLALSGKICCSDGRRGKPQNGALRPDTHKR